MSSYSYSVGFGFINEYEGKPYIIDQRKINKRGISKVSYAFPTEDAAKKFYANSRLRFPKRDIFITKVDNDD